MSVPLSGSLSRRERQILEIVHGEGRVSVGEIRSAMPEPVSYSAVRVIVNVLERKGHLRHTRLGKRYVYHATTPRARAVNEALTHLVDTYFGGSLPTAVAAMIELQARDSTDADVRRLLDVIADWKKGGRR